MLRRTGVAALALLTACTITPSEVAPDAEISLAGSVARQDGTPAANVPVSVVRHEGAAETFAAVVSLGVTCLGDGKELNVCRSGKHTQTDDTGRFAMTMKGSDTQGFFGDASMLEATAILPRRDDEVAGPSATLRFLVQTEQVAVPLRMWEPDIEAVAGPRSATVTWSEIPAAILPPQLDAAAVRTDVVFARGETEIVWSARGQSEIATFDSRLLEDSKGSVSVVAQWGATSVPDDLGRTIVLQLRSGRPGYRSRAGAPPSRGAACAHRLPDGTLVTRAPCPLTDGDFSTPMGPQPCPDTSDCVHSNEIVVDWGAARPLELIVLRGCASDCRIDTSEDGRTWTLAATTAGGDVAVNVLQGTTARFVRVQSDDVEALREVSMWEPGTRTGNPVSILAEVGGGLIPPIEDAVRGPRGVPIAAAALLLALITGALVATASQRTRPAGAR